MSKGFCSSADPTGFLGRRIYSGRNLLHFQLKVGVVVWFFPPFCVQLHSIDWCHCFSMYMYLQPQYCVSYSLNIDNFYNFKTGGVLDSLLILRFLQLKYWVKQKKIKKQVCMTFDSISGPRQRRSLQKLEVSSSLVVWYCVPQQLVLGRIVCLCRLCWWFWKL